MRVLSRPHGSAPWGRGTVSAEAPPGLGFYSVPEAAGLLDRVQGVAGGWQEEEAEGRIRGRRMAFPITALPSPLCRKARNNVLEAWEGGRHSHLIPDLWRGHLRV